jgi:hypothetical protein
MVKFDNTIDTIYGNNRYTVIKLPYKNTIIPVILDTNVYNHIKKNDRTWIITSNGNLHTNIDNGRVYLHELVYYIKNGKKNNKPLIHINKIGLDNRYENIIEDTLNKNIKKNLNKKSRTIKLKSIDTSKIPSFVWYLKKDDSHGERFQVELGDIKWKSTSCNKLSLNYKLEETKKFLREYKQKNPIEFKKNSMNSDLNENGIFLKKQFYNILKNVNMIYEYSINSNTNLILKEDLSKLNKLEKILLNEFQIDSNETTFDRLQKYI